MNDPVAHTSEGPQAEEHHNLSPHGILVVSVSITEVEQLIFVGYS